MTRKKPMTINQYLVRKLGFSKAMKVTMLMSWWSLFMLAEDRPPKNIEELQDGLIAMSLSTLYRYQDYFREAFPQYDTPTALVEHAWAQLEARRGLMGRDLGRVALA